jgi:hypothetical protein
MPGGITSHVVASGGSSGQRRTFVYDWMEIIDIGVMEVPWRATAPLPPATPSLPIPMVIPAMPRYLSHSWGRHHG